MKKQFIRNSIWGLALWVLLLLSTGMTVSAATYRKTVPLNDSWVSQTLAENDDYLFFDFTVPSDGKLVITTQATRNSTYIYLYNDDQTTKYFRQQFNEGTPVEPTTQTMTVWLQAGNYHYVAADNMYGDSFGGAGDIRVKIAFTPANNTETEPNNDFEHAMLLQKGRIVKGALLKIDDRYDFYKITPQPGNDVSIRLTSYAEAYSYTVFDSSFVKLFSGRAPGSETSPGVIDFSIEKPTGSLFYIKISDNYMGEDHTFGIYTLQWDQVCEHTFDAGKVENPATKKDGLFTYTCTKCGYEKHEAIPAIASITLAETSYTYNGKKKTPKVVVTDRENKAVSDENYNVAYPSARKNAGKYKVTVGFKNRYTGTYTLQFTINKASQKITGVSSKKFKKSAVAVEGKKFTLKPKAKTAITYKSGSKYIKVTKKGVVTISKKIPKGTYVITITAKKTTNYKAATKKIKIVIK